MNRHTGTRRPVTRRQAAGAAVSRRGRFWVCHLVQASNLVLIRDVAEHSYSLRKREEASLVRAENHLTHLV